MKGLLKIKSIITILIVVSLIVYAFLTRDENSIMALTTAFGVVVGSLFSKPQNNSEK